MFIVYEAAMLLQPHKAGLRDIAGKEEEHCGLYVKSFTNFSLK
jgi:hypothetical protein